jgi:ubiquitin-conjugating enzyme E2 H
MSKSPGMLSQQNATRRRELDVMKLAMADFDVTQSDNIGEFWVLIRGPPSSLYEDGWWNVHVQLSESYPFKSPCIGFANKILHPNVDEASGSICLDVINQTWTPMYDLKNVFTTFLPQLLTYPNPADPLNPMAANLMNNSPAQYETRVRAHVAMHASLRLAKAAVMLEASPGHEDEERATPPRKHHAVDPYGTPQSLAGMSEEQTSPFPGPEVDEEEVEEIDI